MAAPPLAISIQPSNGNKVSYLPLARANSGAKKRFKLVLRLDILNQGNSTVTVTKIVFHFPNSGIADIEMAGVDLDSVWSPEGGPQIGTGQTKTWSNGIVNLANGTQTSNVIYRDAPAPAKVEVRISCANFSSPKAITRDLAPHSNDNSAGYYMWPLGGTGSKSKPFPSQFFAASAVHWANAGPGGTQIYAHDIGQQRYAGGWVQTVAGGSSAENQGYLIWGRDILAMADGVIEKVHDGMDDNTVLGKFPDPTPDPGTGNHVVVRHGNELVTYCHMQKGSIPGWIVAGAHVDVGEKIGKIGNSGNTTNPHIHIEVVSASGDLRPFLFRGLRVCENGMASPPEESSPWASVNFEGVPQPLSALYRVAGSGRPHHPPRKKKTRFAKPHVPHTRKKKATQIKKVAPKKKKTPAKKKSGRKKGSLRKKSAPRRK